VLFILIVFLIINFINLIKKERILSMLIKKIGKVVAFGVAKRLLAIVPIVREGMSIDKKAIAAVGVVTLACYTCYAPAANRVQNIWRMWACVACITGAVLMLVSHLVSINIY
jgi:hypothetical protein